MRMVEYSYTSAQSFRVVELNDADTQRFRGEYNEWRNSTPPGLSGYHKDIEYWMVDAYGVKACMRNYRLALMFPFDSQDSTFGESQAIQFKLTHL